MTEINVEYYSMFIINLIIYLILIEVHYDCLLNQIRTLTKEQDFAVKASIKVIRPGKQRLAYVKSCKNSGMAVRSSIRILSVSLL